MKFVCFTNHYPDLTVQRTFRYRYEWINEWMNEWMNEWIMNSDIDNYFFTWVLQFMQVKIEKYYVPKFETFVRTPSFHFSTDEYIEAEVESEFTFDKKGFGDCIFRCLQFFCSGIHYKDGFASADFFTFFQTKYLFFVCQVLAILFCTFFHSKLSDVWINLKKKRYVFI